MITINFCIYNAIMFLIPGMYHCSRGYFPFFAMQYEADVIEYTANIVFLFSCVFFISHEFGHIRSQSIAPTVHASAPSDRNMMFLALASIPIAIGFGAILGFGSLFVSRSEYFEAAAPTTVADTINSVMARLPIFVGFVIATLRLKGATNFGPWIVAAATGSVFFVMNFPLAIPRTYLFGYVVTFVLLYIDYRKPLNKFIYVLSSVLVVTTIFGVVDVIARGDGSISFNFLDRYLESGDFDGLQSTINVVLFVRDLGLHFGKNLLSAVFFFVPRSIWSEKSAGTGVDAGEYLRLDFTNLSAPLVAETYVDFGVIGVITGAFLIGWYMARLDHRSHFLRLFAPKLERLTLSILGGFVIILARGSLVAVAGSVVVLLALSKLSVSLACRIPNARVSQKPTLMAR